MSPIVRLCPRCGQPATGPTSDEYGRRYCPTHAQAERRRRHAKGTTAGYGRARWQTLRRQAIAEAGACRACGTPHDLTAHLSPHLKGKHELATLENILVLCRSCHGRIDAPRAARLTLRIVDDRDEPKKGGAP